MADTFASWPNSQANLRPAGLASTMVKVSGDDAYYSLGNVRDVDIKVEQLAEKDSYGRPRPYGFLVDATIPSMQAALQEIEILGHLIVNPLSFRIGYMDGLYLATTSLLSLKWKLMSEGDFNKHRMIEYAIRGAVKSSELDSLFTASPAAIGTPNAADKLYGINSASGQTPVASHQTPNGLTTIGVKASGDAAYADLGDFRDAKYTFECQGSDGGGGRRLYRTTSIKFTFDAVLLQSTLAVIQMFDQFAYNQMDLQLTHMDGVVLTLASPCIGLAATHSNKGNIDVTRETLIHVEGNIPIADPATFNTTWAGLWA